MCYSPLFKFIDSGMYLQDREGVEPEVWSKYGTYCSVMLPGNTTLKTMYPSVGTFGTKERVLVIIMLKQQTNQTRTIWYP